MQPNSYEFSDSTLKVLQIPLIYFACFIALATVTLVAALYFSINFVHAAFAIGACALLALAIVGPSLVQAWEDTRRRAVDLPFFAASTATAMLGGLLAAAINRPDIDDSIYAPKAVYYIEHPGDRLDLAITWIAGLPRQLQALDLQYYETIQAALAWLSGTHFLTIYHLVFPALAGFLMCLGLLLLLSVFNRQKWRCLLGLAFLLLTMLALGESHMAFGNLSIARAFHAKYVFLSVFVPAWVYFSLQYLALGNRTSWFALLSIATGMAGATTTALVFLPLLAFIVALSFYIGVGKALGRQALLRWFQYGLALLPLFLVALRYFLAAREKVGSGTTINAGYPLDIFGQLGLVLGSGVSLTLIMFVLASGIVLWISPYRRFFAAWLLLPFLMLLNPIVDDFVVRYIFPEAVYWRLFYLLPFPLIVGVAFVCLLDGTSRLRIIAGLTFATMGILAVVGPGAVIRSSNAASLRLPAYKIDQISLAVVDQIASTEVSGTMLAPIEISSNLLIYSSHFPQLHMREDYLKFVLADAGLESAFDERSMAYQYIYGGKIEGEPSFKMLLDSETRPSLVVTKDTATFRVDVDNALVSHGYTSAPLPSGYTLYGR
ncbi:MAG: hypothetical protein WBA73_14955 [Devosia sp.]